MKLTAAVIRGELQQQFSGAAAALSAPQLEVGLPALYEPGEPVCAGKLYVAQALQPELCRADVLCVVPAAQQMQAPEPDGNVLYVPASLHQIFNALQDIYTRAAAWEHRLEELLLGGGTTQELLYASQAVFHNPLALVGTDFQIYAWAAPDVTPASGCLFADGFSVELVSGLQQDDLYNRMLAEKAPVLLPPHIIGAASWNLNLWQDGQSTRRLMLLEQTHPLREAAVDGYFLERLAPFVSAMLARELDDTASSSGLHRLLTRILSDRMADYVEMSQGLAELGWPAEDTYFCLLFKITYLEQKNRADKLLCRHLEKMYPFCCSFLYEGDVVTYFHLEKGGKTQQEISDELKCFVRESYLKAGYSRVMTGHDNLRRQYVQASLALDVGSRVNPYRWIHHFNSIAFRYLLEQSTRRLPGSMVCHEKLLVLQQHDETQQTEYMKTLRVYLEQNLNAVQTANRLFIHRSTLLYRLERIKALLESELDNPEELLYLSLSFYLLDNEQNKS